MAKYLDESRPHLGVRVRLTATADGGRVNPAASGYHPAWEIGTTPDGEPMHTSGLLILAEGVYLEPGGVEAEARLYPLIEPEQWSHVEPGQVLRGFEGSRLVATAMVLDISGLSVIDP